MSIDEKNGDSDAVKFQEVLKSEKETIAAQREPDKKSVDDMWLAGLAFSGGGIRSAVFNLGFIQGLANRNSLHVFDYLSTVSGGGYIGGWLSALLHRDANKDAADKDEKTVVAGEKEMRTLQETILKTLPPGDKKNDEEKDSIDFPPSEDKSIRFLRRYSNYLTPRLGLSGDTLALISLMVRNVVVMQMILVSMLVAGFAGLLLAMQIGEDAGKTPLCLGGIAILAILLLGIALGNALSFQNKWGNNAQKNDAQGKKTPNLKISLWVLAPALLSGVLAAIALEKAVPLSWGAWKICAAGVMAFFYALAWHCFSTRKCNIHTCAGIFGGASTLAALLYGLFSLTSINYSIAFSPPAAMAMFSLVITVHLALAGSAISEQSREWWARLGGQGMFLALAWTLAFAYLLYVPPLLVYGWDRATYWLISGGGLAAMLTAFGTYFAKSSDTNGKSSAFIKEFLAKIAPWLFIIFMLGLVSLAFVSTLGVDFERMPPDASTQPFQAKVACTGVNNACDITQTEPGRPTLSQVINRYQGSLLDVTKFHGEIIIGIMSLALLIFALLLWLVDLNLFSAHSFYRNRLARAFLGASQKKRKPDPYTGFDTKDDLSLADLAGQRPVHLLNATLNMTGGENLAWQTRRGACFTFTPCYTGFTFRGRNGKMIDGFRPTKDYGGDLSLATAVATCGAAASPNMGFHTSTSVAALLTAFNLRLARWCPNPTENEWKQCNPKLSAAPLFSELFGNTTGDNAWVNLSDGGHFENLGIYELIRRRVALIVVTDVGADPTFQFDDLAMAVRKIWVDFGVRVEIDEADLDKIRPKGKKDEKGECKDVPRFSEKYWALGRICYPDCDPGYLIYVKSAITDDIPIDIRQYRDAHPAFPHESTADQWFDEDQFEAYRRLGQIIAEKLLDCLLKGITAEEMQKAPASQIIENLYTKAEHCFVVEKSAKPCPQAFATPAPQS